MERPRPQYAPLYAIFLVYSYRNVFYKSAIKRFDATRVCKYVRATRGVREASKSYYQITTKRVEPRSNVVIHRE